MPDQRLRRIESPGSAMRWVAGFAVLLAAGFAALPVDLAVASWCLTLNCPRPIHELFVNAEPFAHGIGVVFILAAVFVLAPESRWALPRLVICVAAAGMAGNMFKLLVSRTRPNAFDFESGVLATFNQWLPLSGANSAAQSTPSAHAATAVGLAIGLWWLYPRGRWLFGGLAVLACGHRVEIGVHFVSDVFWGAAIGWFAGWGIVDGRFLLPSFQRWERRRAAVAGSAAKMSAVASTAAAVSAAAAEQADKHAA